ncbi:MAG: FtsW/RodA/SpoVE family cell cycle protein, partial [Myxococcota bacterium]
MAKPVAKPLLRFDWVLGLLVAMLMGIGLMNLYSSSMALGENLYITQAVWLTLGLGLVTFSSIFDYRTYERWAYVIYGAVVVLLLMVMLVGTRLNGAQRWLNLGFFMLQPSELMKPAIILVAARYFADIPHKPEGNSLSDLARPLGLLFVPSALIMLQPDLGTSLMVIFIFFTIVLFEGIKLRTLVGMGVSVILSAPLAWSFILKDYQKRRILSFLDLEKDPYGPGWQVRQSLIAFGSGGVTGKGHLDGTQVQMG